MYATLDQGHQAQYEDCSKLRRYSKLTQLFFQVWIVASYPDMLASSLLTLIVRILL
jgi:hypothetical protein